VVTSDLKEQDSKRYMYWQIIAQSDQGKTCRTERYRNWTVQRDVQDLTGQGLKQAACAQSLRGQTWRDEVVVMPPRSAVCNSLLCLEPSLHLLFPLCPAWVWLGTTD
jgi:hypothetical protein